MGRVTRLTEAALVEIFGSGSGSGSGSGYGDGDGDGDGSGYGDGDGYGYGDGSGYGYGYGYGDGYGDGDGSGYGYGYGYGDGYGDGDGEYWKSAIPNFIAKLGSAAVTRAEELVALGARLAYWRSDKKGLSANGGKTIEPAAPGVIHSISGPLSICSKGALHGTLKPTKWQGERWWIVALIGEVVGDDEKFGALKREIIGECQ